MNRRQPKKAKQRRLTLQAWTLSRARSAVSYIRSVVGSLREHHLEMIAKEREARRLADRPGRPDRATLIGRQDAETDAGRAREKALDAAHELAAVDIFPLDPARGLAILPFLHDEQLAWYVFDLHDNPPLRFWRFDTDALEERRPITSRQQGVVGTVEVV